MGVSENDIQLYKTWSFGDSERFTSDFMLQLLEIPNPRPIDLKLLKDIVAGHYDILFARNSYTYGCILFLIIYLLQLFFLTKSPQKRNRLFVVLYSLCVYIGIDLYLFYTEHLPYRVLTLLWLTLFIVIAYCICENRALTTSNLLIPFLSLLFGFCLFTYVGCWITDTDAYQEQKRNNFENIHEFYQSVSSDKEHLYIADNATDLSAYCYDTFTRYPKRYLDNLVFFGGWLTNSPIEKSILKNYHVTNPYTAALDSEKVYLIDNTSIDEKLQYIREHYDASADLHFIENRNGFNIYQISD